MLLGARRAKQLLEGARSLVESDKKEIVVALRMRAMSDPSRRAVWVAESGRRP